MLKERRISVLGASGSVGSQALDIARARGYKVDFVSVNRDVSALEDIVREFSPKYAAVADEKAAKDAKIALKDTNTQVLSADSGIIEGIHLSQSDCVINAIIGEAGLMPTLATVDAGKRLALANKESLVIAGEIVMARAKRAGAEIIPVDSEHSAIFQSLMAGNEKEIKKIILTASGGPFYSKTKEELKAVTLEDTLRHPTWKMGRKITVDSATLMNKGFEVIEAVHLFNTPPERVEVVVHRQSILHSAVEYIDNTVIGELSVPDMRMCVQYAVDYPTRYKSAGEELDLVKISALTFEKPNYEAFPLLSLAKEAIGGGGAMPAILNASDEIAVAAFLNKEISFTDISEVVLETYSELLSSGIGAKTLEDIISCDRLARDVARKVIKEKRN